MRERPNQRLPLRLPATIAVIFLLVTTATTFAQKGQQHNRFAFDYRASSRNQTFLPTANANTINGERVSGSRELPDRDATPAQDKTEFPKPDFSVMEEWYEVTKVEYHIFDRMLTYVVNPKVESRPYVFELRYVDEDGTVILETSACSSNLWGAPAQVPIKCGSLTPTETQMEKVKKVYVIRKKE